MKDYCRTGMSLEEIQQNQKIVNGFIKKYKELIKIRKDLHPNKIDPQFWSMEEHFIHTTKNIIETATGKDIQEIHSMKTGDK